MPVSAYMALAFVFGFIPNKLMMMQCVYTVHSNRWINTTSKRPGAWRGKGKDGRGGERGKGEEGGSSSFALGRKRQLGAYGKIDTTASTCLFGEDGSAEWRIADAVVIGRSDAEHVILLRSVVFHRVRRRADVAGDLQPVLARRTAALDDVVNVRHQRVVRQLSGQPRQPSPTFITYLFILLLIIIIITIILHAKSYKQNSTASM